jgi:hypothetical protein
MADTPDVNAEYTLVVTPSCVDNTAATAPLSLAIPALNFVFLWSWNVRVPPGHAGVTGIALIDSGQFVIPFSNAASAWITDDDAELSFNYGKGLGAAVAVYYYNTSTLYTHGWQLRFTYTPLSDLTSTGDVIVTPDLAGIAQDIEASTGGS